MADYALAGLNPRDFEHLVQALALGALGPGVLPFGDGPDGGREATFTGRTTYPSAAEPWDGYVVIQAKFLQRPSGDVARDGAWALRQLARDLAKFEDPQRDLRRPDYYLFVTNVVLTPAGRGTKDQVLSALRDFAARTGVRGVDVWDYDKLGRLLDADADVRRRYRTFITAGDVLGEILAQLEGQRPDVGRVMTAFLARELRRDQFVRLEQAGQSPDQKTALARVFVDLPAAEGMLVGSAQQQAYVERTFGERFAARADEPLEDDHDPEDEPNEESPEDDADDGDPGPGDAGDGTPEAIDVDVVDFDVLLPSEIVAELLEAGTRILRGSLRAPVAGSPAAEDVGRTGPGDRGLVDRFVVIGGPGQGKSTVGQFLCQVYRAAILAQRPAHTIPDDARSLVESVRSQAEADGLTVRGPARFPVRVVLDEFATEVARDGTTSLIGYLSGRVSALTDQAITAADLRRWLGLYPWCLVLDGLDEVPSTSNREQVLEKITNFWDEVALEDADVLVVATTRPQDYHGDFSPARFAHRTLLPLTPARATRYAERLTAAKHAADPERRDTVRRRLGAALNQAATARLMRSPLQVTIMATLVERIGQPPEERWRLFSEYYGVMYQREIEREFVASRVLRQRRPDVDAIHHRAGLWLQTASERAGGTDARLSDDEFRALVRARVAEGEYTGDALEARTAEIANAALQRLVFLVPLEAGRIGFEIRSLQEFTAAEALMQGSDQLVEARLEAIAPVAHWRNVFLFAAGKCFAEREHLRDVIVLLCERLNAPDADPLAAATWTGGRLALDLLEEGVAQEVPKYARLLARRALLLTGSHDAAACDRLARVYDGHLESAYREVLDAEVRNPHPERTLGAWRVLAGLVERGVPWAEPMADALWPAAPADRVRVVRFCRGTLRGRWGLARRIDALLHGDPWQVMYLDLPRPDRAEQILGASVPPWYAAARRVQFGKTSRAGVVRAPLRSADGTGVLTLEVWKVSDRAADLATLRGLPYTDPTWAPFVAAAEFAEDASPAGLARALRGFAEIEFPETSDLGPYPLPWPLAGCLALDGARASRLALADRAERGDLGSPAAWADAERRWARDGVGPDDWAAAADRWPFGADIATVGFPFDAGVERSRLASTRALWDAALAQFTALPPSRARSVAAELALSAYEAGVPEPRDAQSHPRMPAAEFRTLYEARARRRVHYDALVRLIPRTLDADWIDFFAWLGGWSPKRVVIGTTPVAWAADLARAFAADPDRTALLEPLAMTVLAGSAIDLPANLLIAPDPSTGAHNAKSGGTSRSTALGQLRLAWLQLATRTWDEGTVQQASTAILAATGVVRHAVGITVQTFLERQTERPRTQTGTFARVLRAGVLRTGAPDLAAVERVLGTLAGERTSGLGDPTTWRVLGLPELG